MKDIILGQGVEDIVFGMTRDEVLQKLGEPIKVSKESYTSSKTEDLYENWFYDHSRIWLSFDQSENYKLTTIAVNGSEYTVFNTKLMGLSKSEVISFLTNYDIGLFEEEDFSTDLMSNELLTYDDASLNLWFENQRLYEIQFSPFWLDNENEKWPKIRRD